MDDTAANEYFERRVRVAPDAVALAKRMHEVGDRLYPQFCDTDLPPEPWLELGVRDKAFIVALATELLAEGLVSGPPAETEQDCATSDTFAATDAPRPDRALTVEQAGARVDSEFGTALRALGSEDPVAHLYLGDEGMGDPLRAMGCALVCPRCGHDAEVSTRTVALCVPAEGCGWSSVDGEPPAHVRPVGR